MSLLNKKSLMTLKRELNPDLIRIIIRGGPFYARYPIINQKFSERDFSHERICIRRRRTRTKKVRTALSCPCPAGQTDSGQSFCEKSGQNPDNGQNRDRQSPDSGQTPDRISGKSGHKRDTDRTRTVLSADV